MVSKWQAEQSLSQMDDYPLHQVAETMRNVGTSDRNFYDRYYFNLHNSSGELFMVMGMGQYPTLAVQDAFVALRRGDTHRVVRASRELGDRMDTRVGPIRIEVLKGLEKLRFVVEPNEWGIALDLTWDAAIPAFLEPRQYVRRKGRVFFDSVRFAQTGCWSGALEIDGERFEVTPDRWKGSRDRSWGIRPVGEHEPAGIHQGSGSMRGMWNYCPMQFDDFSIIYICNEHNDGRRELEEAVQVWSDPAREPQWLGRPEYEHVFDDAREFIVSSTIRFAEAPEGPIEVRCTPLLPMYVMIGTGYGLDADWKHGMYKGPLVVEGLTLDQQRDRSRFFGLVDSPARFEIGDKEGWGLFEYCFLGPFDRYGFDSPLFWNLKS
ncbi:MAG: hypothetical protein IPI75_07635 [Gammaproteobacteria bacterium]|nr:hypothetical protein [Gammaproteobacteria bacterium]